jgi:hypothetical protein
MRDCVIKVADASFENVVKLDNITKSKLDL